MKRGISKKRGTGKIEFLRKNSQRQAIKPYPRAGRQILLIKHWPLIMSCPLLAKQKQRPFRVFFRERERQFCFLQKPVLKKRPASSTKSLNCPNKALPPAAGGGRKRKLNGKAAELIELAADKKLASGFLHKPPARLRPRPVPSPGFFVVHRG